MPRLTSPISHAGSRRRGVALLAAGAVLASGLAALGAAPAAAEEVHAVPADRVFDLEGRGFGHGRGMSQWGARGAAQLGVGWQEILATYYPGTTPTDAGNPLVRVRLTRTVGGVVVVSGTLSHVDDLGTGRTVALAPGTSRCEGRPAGTGVTLRCLAGSTWTDLGVSSSAQVRGTGGLAVDRPGGYRNTYRGAIRVVRDGSNVVGVAAMTMQEYLYGVVPNESPASWPADALRAQAVAARTYADRGRRAASPTSPWDLCDTTACQVFDGTRTTGPGGVVEEEAAATTRAVDETAGYELYWRGAPAFTEFSASNGGWSVVGTGAAAAYSPAREDPWDGVVSNPAHSWTASLRVSALEARWPQVGRMTRLVVVSRDGRGELGGRVQQVRLEGVDGAGRATAVTVTGEQVRSAAGLRSSWFAVTGVTGVDPVGNLDVVSTGPAGTVTVSGWAADPDAPRSALSVHVYVDGVARAAVVADGSRPDVGAAYPELGPAHGFTRSVTVPAASSYRVCAYGIDVGAGTNALLGCRTVTVDRAPTGALDAATPAFAGVQVRGWALDTDTTAPIDTHLYLDGRAAASVRADGVRPDVGAQFPDQGPRRGFSARLSGLAGERTVCAYGIDATATATNTTLGCRRVTIASAPGGSLDLVEPRTAGVRVRGWAADPETTAATRVHVYADGRVRGQVAADLDRADVGRTHPVLGARHGYDAVLPAMGGSQRICTYGINLGTPGPNATLGCRDVTVPSEPFGVLDGTTADRSGVTVRGWGLDPDTTEAVQVHVYVDGVGRGVLTAASSRPDVAARYPLHGAAHGFDARVPVALAPGSHEVCAYVVNTGAGSGNPLLGCRTVTVG